MEYIIVSFISFIASVVGAICGIGGGVIIKPVLDATGVLPIPTINFLSGVTVLSMSMVSFYKNQRNGTISNFNTGLAVILAIGSIVGGLTGKAIYQQLLSTMSDTSSVGSIQSSILLVITIGTLIYTIRKNNITTMNITSRPIIFAVGAGLGFFSAFLGIGGGPINLVVLFFLFSMTAKEAAIYSIFIIMFSQISSLASTVVQHNVPQFQPTMLVSIIIMGIIGGLVGARVNKTIHDRTVERLFISLMSTIIVITAFNVVKYM